MRNLFSVLASAIKSAFAPKSALVKIEPINAKESLSSDPLDWIKLAPPSVLQPKLLHASDFPLVEEQPLVSSRHGDVMDSAVVRKGTVVDSCENIGSLVESQAGTGNQYGMPPQLQNWYISQSFIGYQACAYIAQHWLVNKACTMPGKDAVRNGWEINVIDSKDFSDEQRKKLKEFDKKMNVREQLAEFVRNVNVFGIRVVLFDVESDDPKYYEKPFNPDGVTEGSYKGIRQIDPIWMMPMLTARSSGDPTDLHFYDPEYWIISGKKYHRSHLVIGRGPQPADFLKPTYIFGGVPLTQQIYERVYAAERTANEAPLLSLSKRTSVMHVDMKKVAGKENDFVTRLLRWVAMRDNHGVKVIDTNETMEQFDTNLSDFDSIIMNQYQLVAAIAEVPATKLLGTSPKGFNATGEFEENSYHESLESIQTTYCNPLLERHHLLATRSMGIDIELEVVWNPTDSMSAEKRATVNKTEVETHVAAINAGMISPDEGRDALRANSRSLYGNLGKDEAETEIGMSPENIAELEKAMSETIPPVTSPVAEVTPNTDSEVETRVPMEGSSEFLGELPEPGIKDNTNALLVRAVTALAKQIELIHDKLIPEGADVNAGDVDGIVKRAVQPSVVPTIPNSVAGIGQIVPELAPHTLPKMKVMGITLSIENPRGTVRAGIDDNGEMWKQTMPHHYGFIRGTSGADGDEVDCFVGPDLKSQRVFVVNQNDADGNFDEHKCLLGFSSPEDAKQGYHDSFSSDWTGFGDMHELSMDEFKAWLSQGKCTDPFVKSLEK